MTNVGMTSTDPVVRRSHTEHRDQKGRLGILDLRPITRRPAPFIHRRARVVGLPRMPAHTGTIRTRLVHEPDRAHGRCTLLFVR